MRKIFGPKRVEETRDWRKLHNELHDMCSSPNFIWMSWTGSVAYTGRKVMHTRFSLGKFKKREY
jgi:hypothetical protein